MFSDKFLKILRVSVLTLVGLMVYIVTAVPVGMFVYTLKSDAGWDVFKHTGFHGYLQCLQHEARKEKLAEKAVNVQ